jgi:membrane dipeptidase
MNAPLVPVFDGHNDVLLRLVRSKANESGPDYSFFAENATGHLDLPRARQGGFAGGIFAIFTPTPPDSPEREHGWGRTMTENGYITQLNSALDPAYAGKFTREAVHLVKQTVAESNGQVALATTVAEIEDCMQHGVLAIVLHFEGAEAIQSDLSDLEAYYQQGLRSLGIVWSRPNAFATGVPFCYPASPDTGPGLTPAGRELVRECNRLGILLDLAHINEKGFWNVAELSNAPLVASHTAAHAICPSTRNLTDAQLDAIGKSGGLVGVIFEPMNVRGDGKYADVPVDQIAAHVDYIVNRIGIDHVGFGSDYDGANVPEEMGSAAGLQTLIQALRARGYDRESLEKVAYRNWLRVLSQTWQ